MSFHVCVWVDHDIAKIIQVEAHQAELTSVANHRPNHHVHRRADHVGLGSEPMDPHMMAEVGAQLADARAILLAGPGQAKFELRTYLQTNAPAVAANIWGVESSDHPTEPQLIAWARAWFKSQDGMHETGSGTPR